MLTLFSSCSRRVSSAAFAFCSASWRRAPSSTAGGALSTNALFARRASVAAMCLASASISFAIRAFPRRRRPSSRGRGIGCRGRSRRRAHPRPERGGRSRPRRPRGELGQVAFDQRPRAVARDQEELHVAPARQVVLGLERAGLRDKGLHPLH